MLGFNNGDQLGCGKQYMRGMAKIEKTHGMVGIGYTSNICEDLLF